MLAVTSPIFMLRELDTRLEFSANHYAVQFSSFAPNRCHAAARFLPDATNRAPSPPLNAGHRAPSPTPSLTSPHSPTATQRADDDGYPASPSVFTPQPPFARYVQLDTDVRP